MRTLEWLRPQAIQLGAQEGLRLLEESVAARRSDSAALREARARLGSLNDVVRWHTEQWAAGARAG